MLFTELINSLLLDTTQSLPRFAVELCLSVTIVLMLLMRLSGFDKLIPASLMATIGALVASVLAYKQYDALHSVEVDASSKIFTGLLIDSICFFSNSL